MQKLERKEELPSELLELRHRQALRALVFDDTQGLSVHREAEACPSLTLQ